MSIVQYYDRLEQTALEIQEERERKPKYYMTLWWGFDGLQESESGTWTWISRRKKEVPVAPAFSPHYSVWNTAPIVNYWSYCQSSEADRLGLSCAQMQNMAAFLSCQQGGPDATIARLQSELVNVNYNIAVSEQQRRLSVMLNQSCANSLK